MSAVWAQERLGHLLAPIDRAEPVDPSRTYRLLGARWYAQGLFVKDEKSGHNIKANTLYRVKAGDFVYNRLFAWKGSFAIADDDADDCHVSNEFPCFAVNRKRLDPSYLKWWFSRESVWLRALGLSSGATPTSRNRLKEAHLLGMEIPLPPLDEQRRIVARIEELAVKVGEARGLRQVLASETKRCSSVAISQLISPHGSRYVKLGEIVGDSSLRNGKSIKSIPAESGIRCLTLGALRDGRIDVKSSKPIPMQAHEARPYLIAKSDIYVVRGNGSKELCGRAGIVLEDSSHTIFPDLFIKVSLPHDAIDPFFFVAAWNSAEIREWIEGEAKTTSGIWKINQGNILAARIPLPPLAEQRRVVTELDALQAKVDAMKLLQAETASELDAMLPAILDKAFTGAL